MKMKTQVLLIFRSFYWDHVHSIKIFFIKFFLVKIVKIVCYLWQHINKAIKIRSSNIKRNYGRKLLMDWCYMNSQPTFQFLTNFSLNEWWPSYQKDVNQITLNHNSLKLSFTYICLNFIECESYLESSSPGILESYLESSSPGILDLCETNLDDWQFLYEGYLPLIQKDSAT